MATPRSIGTVQICPGRTRRALLGTALLVAALLVALLPLAAAPAEAAKVTLLQRPVQVKPAGATKWRVMRVGDEVTEGDSIRTGMGGRCEITITPKRVFRIGEASEITLDKMLLQDGNLQSKVRVLLGRIWSAMVQPPDPGKGESYAIETPTVTMGIKGTRFDVNFNAKTGALQTTVLEGQVVANPSEQPSGPPVEVAGPRQIAPPQQITRAEWTLLVSANQKLIFVPGEEPKVVPITAEDLADEWVKFNNARDRAMR